MDNEGVVYIHNKILMSHKNNEILPFVTTWMYKERQHADRERQIL